MLKKIKIKKIIKVCLYIIVILGFFFLFAEFALRYLLPLPSVKTKILDKISQAIGADLKAGDITAGIFGIEIDNIIFDTTKGALFSCKNIKIAQNPFKLLKGEISVKDIYINEPILQIIRYQDGSFNFDPLLSPAKEEAKSQENKDTGIPVDLRIKTLDINKGLVVYLDLKDKRKVNIKNLNLSLNNFSFYKPFDVNLAFITYFKQEGLIIEDLKLALSARTNLNEFDLKEASFDLKQLLIKYKETLLKTKVKIDNFENPQTFFNIQLENLSSNTLSQFAATPKFNLPLITSKGSFAYFTDTKELNINNLNFALKDTKLDLNGSLNFTKEPKAKGKITLQSVLDSLEELSPLIKEYQPKGQLLAAFDFAWPLNLSGNLDLKDIGFFTDKAGTFENINTTLEVKNLDDIKMDNLNGIINKNPFTAKATYLKKKDYADVFFDFKADKLYLIDTSKKEKTDTSQTKEENLKTNTQTTKDITKQDFFVPLNVNANIVIGKIDVPYIKGNKLNFTAKAQNITPKMDKVHGLFDLNIQDGQIKDVYTIANANAITKVMFMSLGIVSRVINTLNVLDLLNGIGKVISGGDKEDGQEDEIIKHQKINGKLAFDSFRTNIDFNQGFATIKQCSFVSDLFSFRVNGNINFDSRNINLNVDSAPGKHTEEGIMPLNINIKGTIEEPKSSLSVLSSVSSLVGDTVTNNPVSNMLKKGWGKLFSSEKEKKPVDMEEEDPSLDNTEEPLTQK